MNNIEPELLYIYKRLKKMHHISVADIMIKDVVTLDYEDLLATAARIMIENKINGVIVMRNGLPYSILSSWDLLHTSYLESFSDQMDYLRTPIGDLIENPHLEFLSPNASVADATRKIATTKVKTIAVVDAGKLVGVFSITDLIHYYYTLFKK